MSHVTSHVMNPCDPLLSAWNPNFKLCDSLDRLKMWVCDGNLSAMECVFYFSSILFSVVLVLVLVFSSDMFCRLIVIRNCCSCILYFQEVFLAVEEPQSNLVVFMMLEFACVMCECNWTPIVCLVLSLIPAYQI